MFTLANFFHKYFYYLFDTLNIDFFLIIAGTSRLLKKSTQLNNVHLTVKIFADQCKQENNLEFVSNRNTGSIKLILIF